MIVLDASLTLAWLLGEPQRPVVDAVLAVLPDVPVTVPSHWPLEISNALASYLRGKRIGPAHLTRFLDELENLDISIEPPLMTDEIVALASFSDSQDLTAYDAAYVQLALHQGAILATLDEAMRAAAQRLNIPLLPA